MICPIRFIYTIQPGDSIYRIANIFKTTVHNILDMNPGLVANDLYIGTEITICPGSEFLESLNNIIYPPARPIPPIGTLPPSGITPPIGTLPPSGITPPIGTLPPSGIMPFNTAQTGSTQAVPAQTGTAQTGTAQNTNTSDNGVQYYRYN